MKKTHASKLLLSGLALAAMLAGCGKNTPATPTKALPTRAPLQGQPTYGQPGYPQVGAGLPGTTGTPGAADVQQLLAAVRQTQATQTGFTATVETYEKGPKGDSEAQTIKVAYKRPSTLKLQIVKATGESKDAQVLWNGGSDMKVKPSWLPFSVSVGISDDRVISRNGWTIKQTDVSMILTVLLDPSTQAKSLGPQIVQGKQVILLECTSPKSPAGVTKEQIGIDTTLNLPIARLLYKGNTLAYRLVATTFKPGTPSSDALQI